VNATPNITVRADRMMPGTYRLAPPTRLDSGAWRFEAVVSTPGVNRYPSLGLVEWVSEESISRADYLDGLAGIPVIDDPALHTPGVSVDDLARARIGSVLSARWDAEQKATIATIVIDDPRGIRKIRADGVTGVSLHYTPSIQPADTAPDGSPITGIQTGRSGINHLLLTPTPNDPPARIRADQGDTMSDRDAIIAAIRADMDEGDALGKILDMLVSARMDGMSYRERADKAEADLEALRADMAPRGDSAGDWRAALDLAGRLNVKIPDAADINSARREIVKAKIPARADAADADLGAVIEGLRAGLAAAPVAPKTADVWSGLAGRTVRADASGAAHDPILSSMTPEV
jgi:hypothetical protein